MIVGELRRGDPVDVWSGRRYVRHRFYRMAGEYRFKMRCGKAWSKWSLDNRSIYLAAVCRTCKRLSLAPGDGDREQEPGKT